MKFYLLVLIELFSRGRTAEAYTNENRSKIGDFAQRDHIDPKFHVEGDQ